MDSKSKPQTVSVRPAPEQNQIKFHDPPVVREGIPKKGVLKKGNYPKVAANSCSQGQRSTTHTTSITNHTHSHPQHSARTSRQSPHSQHNAHRSEPASRSDKSQSTQAPKRVTIQCHPLSREQQCSSSQSRPLTKKWEVEADQQQSERRRIGDDLIAAYEGPRPKTARGRFTVEVEETVILPDDTTVACTATESEKEEKRKENYKMYRHIYQQYKEKFTTLNEVFHKMDMKLLSKVTRIQSMDNRSCLSYEQRMEVDRLKTSAKKLETKMVQLQNELRHRRLTLREIKRLGKQSLNTSDPMAENPTMSDFHPHNFVLPAQACWEDDRQEASSERKSECKDTHLSTASQIKSNQDEEAIRQRRELERQKEEELENQREQKRHQNSSTYYEIYRAQRNKASKIEEQLKQMVAKQASKQSRIAAMKSNWSYLRIEEKLHYKNLKKSLKRLEKKLTETREELTLRENIIKEVSELQSQALRNPNPMDENPCADYFEQRVQRVTALLQSKTAHTTPPPTPAAPVDNLVRPFNDPPVPDESSVKRPTTRSLKQRLHPKAVIAALQKKLGKKSKNKRPLGAHHGRIRSRTQNMQEIIPYRTEHLSDEEEDGPQDRGSIQHYVDTTDEHIDHSELLAMYNDICAEDTPESEQLTISESSEEVSTTLKDDWQYPVESDSEPEAPKVSLRMPNRQLKSPGKACATKSPVESTVQPLNRRVPTPEPAVVTDLDRLLEELESNTELEKIAKEKAHRFKTAFEAKMTDKQIQADIAEILGTSEQTDLVPCPARSSKQSTSRRRKWTIKPRGRKVAPSNHGFIVVTDADLNRLQEAYSGGELERQYRAEQRAQTIPVLCELIMEAELKDDPEIIKWFVSPTGYKFPEEKIVRRLIQLYKNRPQ